MDLIHNTRVKGFWVKCFVIVAGTVITISCPKGKAAWLLWGMMSAHIFVEHYTLKGDRLEHRHRQDLSQQLSDLNTRISDLEGQLNNKKIL